MDKSAQDRNEPRAGVGRKEADLLHQEENRQGQNQGPHFEPIRFDREVVQPESEASAIDASPQPLDYRFARTAAELMQAGMDDAALDICQRGIRQFPEYAIGYQVLGDLYLKQKKTISATFTYLEALKRDPDNPLTLMKLGDLHRAEGELAEATRYYREALSLEPGAAALLSRLTAVLEETGGDNNPIKAESEFVPASVLATETAANLFLEQGYKEKARAIYLRLLRLSPNNQQLREKLELCN